MPDILSKKKRSWLMAQVKRENTKPEIIVRSFLHKRGYRFRLHVKSLPGSPDIVLKKYKTAIFVHGCFWHQHKNCVRSRPPRSNAKFWLDKFSMNLKRDLKNKAALRALGWQVIIVWECRIDRRRVSVSSLEKVVAKLQSRLPQI